MNNHSEQQKLDAVQSYRCGERGLRATAALHNVDVASLRKWVAAYEAIGSAGIQRKRRQTYDLKFKLEVLQKIKSQALSNRQADRREPCSTFAASTPSPHGSAHMTETA